MELRHLRYFVGVARAGGFAKAATALRIAQPALSRQVQDLERELGTRLFERDLHGVTLTRAGKRFLADAQALLADAQRAASRVKSRTSSDESLTIAYGELVAYWRAISDIFQGFRRLRPAVELHAVQMGRPEVLTALRADRVDAAVFPVTTWPPRGVDGLRLFSIPHGGVMISADHPLAKKERLHVKELVALPWLHLRPELTWGGYPVIRSFLRKHGCPATNRKLRAPSFGFVPQVAAGDGWALCDEALGKSISAMTTAVVYRPLIEGFVPVWVALLWRRGEHNENVADLIKVARHVSDRTAQA